MSEKFDATEELRKLAAEFREDGKASGWQDSSANNPVQQFIAGIHPNPTLEDVAATIPDSVVSDLANARQPENTKLAEILRRIAEPGTPQP